MRKFVDADALKKKFVAQRDKIEKEKKYGWEFTANGLNIAISITGIEAALYGVDATQPEKCEDCGNFNKTMPLIPQPEQRWIPCSEKPDTERNVFVARGTSENMSVCVGHYDHGLEQWYEDRNWFARCLYDGLYWCEMPPLPEPWKGET